MAVWRESSPGIDAGHYQAQGLPPPYTEFEVDTATTHTGYWEGEAWARPRCVAVSGGETGLAQDPSGALRAGIISSHPPPLELQQGEGSDGHSVM